MTFAPSPDRPAACPVTKQFDRSNRLKGSLLSRTRRSAALPIELGIRCPAHMTYDLRRGVGDTRRPSRRLARTTIASLVLVEATIGGCDNIVRATNRTTGARRGARRCRGFRRADTSRQAGASIRRCDWAVNQVRRSLLADLNLRDPVALGIKALDQSRVQETPQARAKLRSGPTRCRTRKRNGPFPPSRTAPSSAHCCRVRSRAGQAFHVHPAGAATMPRSAPSAASSGGFAPSRPAARRPYIDARLAWVEVSAMMRRVETPGRGLPASGAENFGNGQIFIAATAACISIAAHAQQQATFYGQGLSREAMRKGEAASYGPSCESQKGSSDRLRNSGERLNKSRRDYLQAARQEGSFTPARMNEALRRR